MTKDVGTSERKVIKRRHYCKICGESFQFAVLLRKHEKEHFNSANIFECKSCHKVLHIYFLKILIISTDKYLYFYLHFRLFFIDISKSRKH